MNIVTLSGRLTSDPKITYTQGEKPLCIARYSLAVERRFKKEGQPTADFINCVAMGKGGEFTEKYLHKGMKIIISGHIQTGSYTNKDGNKVYTTEVVVDNQEFAESKAASQIAEDSKPTAEEEPAPKSDGEFMNVPDGYDDDLPFH